MRTKDQRELSHTFVLYVAMQVTMISYEETQ